MKIETSNGEIIDKYTILEIKKSEIKDADKLKNICNEYDTLQENVNAIYDMVSSKEELKKMHLSLLEINKKLWKIEDDIRECERTKDFSQAFIDLARAVYFTNDERSVVKKQINTLTGSNLVEEKSYKDYSS